MNEKLPLFRKFALLSTMATYMLIFIGGLVRVSGAGLGCPDWPKCFGSWIPPLSKNQIPHGFDATSFNFTLAWIEYLNRLAGMITGFLILVTAILAIMYFRKNKNLLIPSVLAAIFVAFQGWYGSIVVKSQLMPLTVSIHLFVALVIVSLLVYTTVNIYMFGRPLAGPEKVALRPMFLILWGVMIMQILLGTEIRSQVEIIWEQFPLLSSAEVLTNVGMVAIIHTFLGILLTGGSVLISLRSIKIKSLSNVGKQGLILMNFLIFIQIVIGMFLHLIGIIPLFQVFHLWLASILIGLILVYYTGLAYKKVIE